MRSERTLGDGTKLAWGFDATAVGTRRHRSLASPVGA